MDKLSTSKTMKTKEVAEALGITPRAIVRVAKKCLPNKVIEPKKQTFWTEEELTVLLDYMKTQNNRTDLTSTTSCRSAETSLSLSFEIEKATALVEQANAHLHNLLKEQIARLTAENSTLSERNTSLQVRLDEDSQWASVKRMEALNKGMQFSWRALKQYAIDNGYELKDVFDANYGSVKAYPKEVWEVVYGEQIDFAPWDKE